ncbi:MAG: ABC transporter permease [Bdellovibrionia bacterium]
MKVIWVIAVNTYKEIIRDRILYGLLVFAVLLMGLSLALGELSFREQARITADFGLAGVHLSAVILAIFVGSTLVSKEIEKRTIFTLLSHAVTRTQFLAAKIFGMTLVLLTVMVGLTAILLGLFNYLGMPITEAFFIALFGVLLEAAILLSLIIFFGMFSSPLLSVIFTLGLFIVGHWLNDLKFFAEKSDDPGFKRLAAVIGFGLPNLERFNWRSQVVYTEQLPLESVVSAAVYAGSWVLVCFALAALIFRKRDFV